MAAVEMIEVEVLVMVDDQGQWEVGTDEDDLAQRWADNIGELEVGATRLVRVKVKVPCPKPVEVEATVAEEPNGVELKVA